VKNTDLYRVNAPYRLLDPVRKEMLRIPLETKQLPFLPVWRMFENHGSTRKRAYQIRNLST